MAFNTSKRKNTLFTEINITPLTDIFLVLLIIMMVIAPTFQSNDSSIKMPEINSGISVEQKQATISVTKEGYFFVNGKLIAEDSIYSELLALKPTLEKKEIVVKADESVKSKEIMKIMKAAQEAEYEKLVVAGKPLSKKEQNNLKKNIPPSQVENNSEITESASQSVSQDNTYDYSEYRGTVGEIPTEE
jgi:biopolymer transport protein ExbD/biopolymer transport protein TolR